MPREKKHRLSKLRDKISGKRRAKLQEKIDKSKLKRKDLVYETVESEDKSTYQPKKKLSKRESKKHQRLFEKEKKRKRKIQKLKGKEILRKEDRGEATYSPVLGRKGMRVRDTFKQQYD